MATFKQIREAAKYNPYAIGMAAAKKKAGITDKHAEGLPKAVIVKGHEIAKKIKANESFDAVLETLELEIELESYTAAEVEEFMQTEAYNQLDELSKKTLGSYVKKASADVDKLTKSYHKSIVTGDNDTASKTAHKLGNRDYNVYKAEKRLTKEEVEELDELDKKTLGSYITKSHDQLMKHTGSVNMKFGRGDKDAVAYSLDPVALRKTANRTKGMKQAIDKLAKE